jgi:formate hydrogenlyase subunit 4
MTSFLIQGLCTDLAVVILVGLFDGINRVLPAYLEQQRRDELIRRGFIL